MWRKSGGNEVNKPTSPAFGVSDAVGEILPRVLLLLLVVVPQWEGITYSASHGHEERESPIEEETCHNHYGQANGYWAIMMYCTFQ